MATRATESGTIHPARLRIQFRVSNLPLSCSGSPICAMPIGSVGGDCDLTLRTTVVAAISPVHTRKQQSRIYAISILHCDVYQRIQQGLRKQMRFQAEFDQLGVLGVVVVL